MVVYVDLQLTVLAFVPLTLVAVGCYFYGIEAKKRQTRRQEAFSSLSDKVQESLSGVRVLKLPCPQCPVPPGKCRISAGKPPKPG